MTIFRVKFYDPNREERDNREVEAYTPDAAMAKVRKEIPGVQIITCKAVRAKLPEILDRTATA